MNTNEHIYLLNEAEEIILEAQRHNVVQYHYKKDDDILPCINL